ncbi:hypothetical protein AURDEDRAFT_148225 [Auricularia subglabra TFB-10046 SS5]|nr:hypothetical protein AURDEDRAFT_148225 [Auricularia subglabra TFB-10046 SS5]
MTRLPLPSELLLLIFERHLDVAALSRLCCTCRRFRAIAEPILYRRVVLAGKRRIVRFIKTLIARPGLASGVRFLDVDWTSSAYEERECDAAFWQFWSRGPYQWEEWDRALDMQGAFWTSGDPPNTSPISVAEARNMTPSFRCAIRDGTTCAFVVLLLDMLPNLDELIARPSNIQYWFWTAFPDPYHLMPPLKKLPQGLANIRSLEIRYCLVTDEQQRGVSMMNRGEGFGHIKIICALLLPNLRRLVFSGDEGYPDEWDQYFTEENAEYGEGEPLYLEQLAGRSTVTDLKLVDSELPDELLMDITAMMEHPETVYYEQFGEHGFDYLNAFVKTPSLRSLSVIEYGEWAGEERELDVGPCTTLGAAHNLSHLALPILALSSSADDDLRRAVPGSLETLDITFGSAKQLHEYVPSLVAYMAARGAHECGLQRLTVRPAPLEADAADLRRACASSGIAFFGAPHIERPEELSMVADQSDGRSDWYYFNDEDYDDDHDGGHVDEEDEDDGEEE